MSNTLMQDPGTTTAKPWLRSYPPGMPSHIDPLPFNSIGELLAHSCEKYAEYAAFTCMGKTLTFRDLDAYSKKIGAWLQSTGLVKGDRVVVMMPNILQNPVIVFGILRAGYTVVNVNPLYTPRELEHQLTDSGAKAIFVLENFAHTVEQVATRTDLRHTIVAATGDLLGLKGLIVNFVVRRVRKLVPSWSLPGHLSFKTVIAECSSVTLEAVDVKSSDVALLQYTGGTTWPATGQFFCHLQRTFRNCE